jgi:hypothetical protein
MVARLSSTSLNPSVASLDGRTLAARRLKKSRQQLLDFIGHPPSPLEDSLIDRIGVLTERVHELEARVLRGVDGPEDSGNLLIMISNLHKLLEMLGWKSDSRLLDSQPSFAVQSHHPLDAA